MEFEFVIGEQTKTVRLTKTDKGYLYSDGETSLPVKITRVSPNMIFIKSGNRTYPIYLAKDKNQILVHLQGREIVLKKPAQDSGSWSGGEGRAVQSELWVKAPMPGKVIKIPVSENEEIRKNQTLAIVEAMKMENEIKSGIDAIVKTILVKVGDLVDSDKTLIELEKRPD